MSVFPTLVVLATLALLPFVKGGVVGACWAFDIVRDPRDRILGGERSTTDV